jgi:uncharacterized protein YjeT (DUF2065 family)
MTRSSVKLPLLRIFVLRLATFAGGGLFGMGLLVLAQVQVVRALQREVQQVGFLGRALGRLTFPWRSLDEKLALALDSLPAEWLRHTHTSGVVLVVLGVVVGYLLPFAVRAWWWSRRAK